MKPIGDVARAIGIDPAALEPYGHYKAKLPLSAFIGRPNRGKLVLVSAITPTPAGEGKTTTSVGLADGLAQLGKRVAVTLRQPSMGPTFGIKGSAAGGGGTPASSALAKLVELGSGATALGGTGAAGGGSFTICAGCSGSGSGAGGAMGATTATTVSGWALPTDTGSGLRRYK